MTIVGVYIKCVAVLLLPFGLICLRWSGEEDVRGHTYLNCRAGACINSLGLHVV